MLTLKQGIRLSAIIDKLGLEIKTTKRDSEGKEVFRSQEELGADLMMQVVSKAHRAEQELYAFVAEIKGISAKGAESVDLVSFIKELAAMPGVADFFKSAAMSKGQE